AEAFVIAKLLKAGFEAHDARRDAPYDVGVDLGKGRICRIQVKGRERAHHGKWDFRFVRGNPRTGAGAYAYTAADFDISACVSLSLDRVAFFPGVRSCDARVARGGPAPTKDSSTSEGWAPSPLFMRAAKPGTN